MAAASTSERVRAFRQRMRALGLRQIEVWVPDVRDPAFSSEARLQSLAVASSPEAVADQDFIDSINVSSE